YYPGGVQVLAFAPGGRTLAAGGQAGFVVLWDLASGKRSLGEINPTPISGDFAGPVTALAFGAGGRTLAFGCWNGLIYECDLALRKLRRRLQGFGPTTENTTAPDILSLAFAPGGQTLAAGGSDRIIHVWELPSGKQRSFGGRLPKEQQQR